MATHRTVSCLWIYLSLWYCFCSNWKEVTGTVHLMSATSTPYGAYAADRPSFSCLLSPPDTGLLNSIQTGRHVLTPLDYTLTLPEGSGYSFSSNLRTYSLPANSFHSVGLYYCEVSRSGQTTRVPVSIMANNAHLHPSGQFTVTVNNAERVNLKVDVITSPTNAQIIWEKQGDQVEDFIVVQAGSSTTYTIIGATAAHAGVYYVYWNNLKSLGSYIRLIVRSCSHGKWNPPLCNKICDNCYNGGICDDKTGECVCRPGFIGPNCLTACGEDRYGWYCEHHCSSATCSGSVFCMPDPVGCSCMTGWTGNDCNEECPSGMYGAGCTQSCNCMADVSCDRFTGVCDDGMCANGWKGNNCQIPDDCPPYYFGSTCTDKCYCNDCDMSTGCVDKTCLPGFGGPNCQSECHCLNGAVCDKMTAKCDLDPSTGLSLCEPGYVSSTGINLDKCQQYLSCFAECTKTYHCANYAPCNIVDGICSNGCLGHWSGASCQTGILEFVYRKTNPTQELAVSCVVTSDNIMLNGDEVTLHYSNNGNLQSIGENPGVTRLGNLQFLNFSYTIDYPAPPYIGCRFMFEENGISHGVFAWINPTYYVLPTLTSIPYIVADSLTPTSVTIQWDAWNPENGDTGDGPISYYNIYDQISMKIINIGSAGDDGTTILSRNLQGLTPNMYYLLKVVPVREGPGGEGSATQTVSFATPPQLTNLSTTESATTARITSKTLAPPFAPDTTTSSVGDEQTSSHGPSMKSTEVLQTDEFRDTTTTGKNAEGGDTNEQAASLSTYIAIGVIVALIAVLVLVLVLVCFIIRRRSLIKAGISIMDELNAEDPPSKKTLDDDDLPPNKKALDDDVDDDTPMLQSESLGASMSSLTALGSVDIQLEEEPEPEEVSPAKPDPPPIPTDSAAEGPGLVSKESIKRRLQIPPVNVKDFANYVKAKKENAELRQEWESLPKNLCRPTTMGKKPENKGKNRFRNVVAYDHSRVVLEPHEDDPHSDYINACYIKGIGNPRAYIASQGPNEVSIGDHWRMIWQENISVTVMACNIIENGKLKCVKYWPAKGTHETFGDIDVTIDSEEQKNADFMIRKFTISKAGEGVRKVVQLHYTNWPDKDIPKHCTPVLQFLAEVNELYQDRTAPLLIHCSAGAGRTGALIAIHAMMELAEQKQQVDIYNFVFSMRNSRSNIVQTHEQYAFVHDAILEHLFCKDTFVKAEDFAARLKTLQEQNPDTSKTFLEEEYEILNLVSPSFSSFRTRGSRKDDCLTKLRTGDSIPVDSSRPYLMTSREDGDMSPYINAAYMDGYKKKDLFISTQAPMTNTVVDLWRMMYDYNCTCIVHLNAMDHNDEDCPQYWPDEGTSEYGPFSVSLMEKETAPDFEIKTLRLVYTRRDVKSPIPVQHFQYTTWPKGDERPATSEGILKLISAVEKWQKMLEQPGPIVVMCLNAAGRTGAFCTIQTCLDQIREEQGANVLQNVKQLRINRTNMIDTPAKYLFCYETILEYLKAFDDYASKKSYQNVTVPDVKKDLKKPKEPVKPAKMKKPDDGVIYGNQEIIDGMNKEPGAGKGTKTGAVLKRTSKDLSSKSPESSSSSPSTTRKTDVLEVNKNEATSKASPSVRKKTSPAKPSPSSKRKSTPPVVSRIKPAIADKSKSLARARPKTYVDETKPIVEEGGDVGAEGEPKKRVNEQLYQNMAFDTQF